MVMLSIAIQLWQCIKILLINRSTLSTIEIGSSGLFLTAGFSEFGTDNKLTEEQVKAKRSIQHNFGWRSLEVVVNNKLSEIIENAGDPTSEDYLKISASWELGFSEYNVVVSSGWRKNIENAEIVQTLIKSKN